MKSFILIMALVILSAPNLRAKIPEQHLKCATPQDCLIIGMGGCCGADAAVNKTHAAQYQRPTKKACHSRRMSCPKVVADCESMLCVKKTLKECPDCQKSE